MKEDDKEADSQMTGVAQVVTEEGTSSLPTSAVTDSTVSAVNPVVQSYIASISKEEGTELHNKLAYLKIKGNRYVLDLSPKVYSTNCLVIYIICLKLFYPV